MTTLVAQAPAPVAPGTMPVTPASPAAPAVPAGLTSSPAGVPGGAGGDPRVSRETRPWNLPLALRQTLWATPGYQWHQLRAYLCLTEQEGELVELLPELRRALQEYSVLLGARIQRGEIAPQEVDRGFARLHDSLHGIKDALQNLQELTRPRSSEASFEVEAGHPADSRAEASLELMAGAAP